MNEATLQFINNHLNDDVYLLSLLSAKFPEVDMPLAIRQILGKQKVIDKIPSFYACENILYPAKLSLEQSSSEISAKHKSQVCEGKILIDLTGGFGVDCYFFSFHFDKLIYVERQKELCELAQHNFKALGRKNIEVYNDEAEQFLEKCEKVDWIYLDPARRSESGKKVVLLSDCEPNVSELHDKLLSKAEKVMIKLSPMIDLSNLMRELPNVVEIQIIAIENECKEVVAILKQEATKSIKIKTANYPKLGKVEEFEFTLEEEQNSVANHSNQLQNFLYEPNAAVMKSGAFKLISSRFNIDKLHINSHLYTSNDFLEDFPGRKFKIEKQYDFSKETIKTFQKEIKKANLATRNFPLSVNDLRKKLKLQEGGENYIFATTLNDGKKVLLNCSKIKS